LRAAEEWIGQAAGHEEARPTALQAEFIHASRRAEIRGRRRIAAFTTFTLVFAVLTALLAGLAAHQAVLQARALEKLKVRPTVTVTVSGLPRPAVTVTERITASPQPGVTVTERVTASPRPNSTVTQFIAVASSGDGSDLTGEIAAVGTGIAGLGTAAAGYAAIVTVRRKREPVKARRTYHPPVPRR
jgi:hypothetical protein